MPAEIARQWFVPGEGIDRHVISANIQRFLGNDATVRPGIGSGEHLGVDGYWIKAYRNLTSAMVEDLQRESASWRKEKNTTGTRGSHSPMLFNTSRNVAPDMVVEPYTHSDSFHQMGNYPTNRQPPPRSNADSPMRESPFSVAPPPLRDPRNAPPDRMQADRMNMDRMPTDPSIPPPQDMRFGPSSSRNFPPDSRPLSHDGRDYGQDGRSYPQDQAMTDAPPYGRIPIPPYVQDPRYPNFQNPEGPPPGYVRQGNFYVPITTPYEHSPTMATSRSESTQYPTAPYGGPPTHPSLGRDPRDQREQREPRYGQNEYADPRYPYPSPAPTVSSVASQRDAITSPSQPSYSGPQGPYNDSYGRSIPPGYGLPGTEPGFQTGFLPPSRDQSYGRERPGPPPTDTRDYGRERPAPTPSDSRDYGRERPAPTPSDSRDYARDRPAPTSSESRDYGRERPAPPQSESRDARRRRVQ